MTQKPVVFAALDGRSGVGKTTIAEELARKFEVTVVTSDDFYAGGEGGGESGWDGKTAQEKVEMVIDWRRMRREVLEPLQRKMEAHYHPFDFESGSGLDKKTVVLKPAPLVLVEGAYSARPELSDLMDVLVLVVAPDNERRWRLVRREGEVFTGEWHGRWDDAEEYYFSEVRPREAFDFVLVNEELP